MIQTLLLDLDNTIYPASSGVAAELSRLINLYTARHLGVSEEEALVQRRGKFHEYGTTMKWLQQEHGLKDYEDFFKKVHPPRIEDFLTPDPRVAETLKAITLPMAIFTNAPEEHARRVTDFYGITEMFARFFDIRYHQLKGKPHRECYQRVLNALDWQPETTLLVDDQTLYLAGFREMGGQTLLIREAEPAVSAPADGAEYPEIRHITELPDYLAGLPE